jgi:hypothetical protein
MDPSTLTDGAILSPPDASRWYYQNLTYPATQTPCHIVWSGPTFLDTDNHGKNLNAGSPPNGFHVNIGPSYGPVAYPGIDWLSYLTSGNYFSLAGSGNVDLDPPYGASGYSNPASVGVTDPGGTFVYLQLLDPCIVHFADLHAPLMQIGYYPKAAPPSGYPNLGGSFPAKNPGGPYIYGGYSLLYWWWKIPDVTACGEKNTTSPSDSTSHLVLSADSPGPGYEKLNPNDSNAAPTPVIDNVEPNHGQGGTNVILRGSGFGDGATVKFAGVAATGVTVVSQYQIQCTAPTHADGTVSVVVSNVDGVSSAP